MKNKIAIRCEGADLKSMDELKAFQGEIKTLSDTNLEKLMKAILKQGFCAPIFVWLKVVIKGKTKTETCFILDGHQRMKALEALKSRGYEIPPLPVVYIRADNEKEAKEKLLHITSQYGDFNKEGLDRFILEAELDISDIDTIRLTHKELRISPDAALGATEGDDEVPEEAPRVTRKGDVWTLGKHKLICGDSQEKETYEKLLGEQPVDLLLTDPPYNVDYTGKTKEALKIKNDKKKKGDFKAFLLAVFGEMIAPLKSGAPFYIWHSESEGHNFRSACQESGLEIRQCLIWNKNSMVMGRQDYHWKHEPCLYGWKKGGTHKWYGDRKQTTVLDFERPTKSTEHPTMKPVNLLSYLILNSTKSDDLILDPFLGSGSTLIACEKTERICYGIEVDEHYCDVIIRRYVDWCGENGRKPRLKRNGEAIDPGKLSGETVADKQRQNSDKGGEDGNGKQNRRPGLETRGVRKSQRASPKRGKPDRTSAAPGRTGRC